MGEKTARSIIVFYSLEGNTRLIAKGMAKVIGADILEVVPEKKEIPKKGFLKYLWGGKQVMTKEMPEIMALEKEVADYDTIFLGTPVWAWTFTPPIRTFLASAKGKLSGKKIALFCCHGGNPGKTFIDIKAELPGNEFVGEMAFFEPLKKGKDVALERAKKWALEITRKKNT